MDLLYDIKIDTGHIYQAYGDSALELKKGDFCLFTKNKYLEYGQVNTNGKELPPDFNKTDFSHIERKANLSDKSKANENQMRAKSALRMAQVQIEKLGLQMKLLCVHYTYDGRHVIFFFVADGRVDFRQLVKDLTQMLNIRIELRQIGVRDETALLGGFGCCGQVFCCKNFIKKFDSINVKMAKEQDLSLNPINISGACGRLKCCLKYEHEGYKELDKGMPRRGLACECSEGIGKIVDRNLLTQKVTVQIDETGKTVIYPKDDISVIYPDKYKINTQEAMENEVIPEEILKLED